MISKHSTFPLLACAAAMITAWAAAGVAVAAQTETTARPDLTGQWQLNPDLSEDAQEKLQEMRGGGRRGGHGPGMHGGGGGRSEDAQEAMHRMMEAPTSMVIIQKGPTVTMTGQDGRVRTLYTDGRTDDAGEYKVRSMWENHRLVAETTVGNATLVETYERSPSTSQLIVAAKMEMHGRQVTVRRVYDPVTEPE